MKKLFFIFPEFKDTTTGGTSYDQKVSKYLKKLHVPLTKIIVSNSINRVKLSYLINNLPKKSIILIDGYLVNKISFLFHNNIHILIHHPCCLEKIKGKMSDLNLFFNEKRALSNSKSIITVSQYMKKIINSLTYKIVDIAVAYPGIDKNYYLKKTISSSKNILVIGNVIERKGYHLLIESLAQIKSDWHLNIIGKFAPEDPYYLSLIEKINMYKIADNISFLGNISDAKKIEYMCKSKIFVLPTFYEGFGISLVEASAIGLNVITTDLPVLREVLKGGNIQFIPINGSKELSEAIQKTLLEKHESKSNNLKCYNWQTTAKIFKRTLHANS